MFLIKELIRGRQIFGVRKVPELGHVDWGKTGENIIEVPDALGRKLISYGRRIVYREVKLPPVFYYPDLPQALIAEPDEEIPSAEPLEPEPVEHAKRKYVRRKKAK